MARKKTSSSDGGALLFVAVFAIVTIITIGSIFYIAFALLMWGMRARQSKRMGEALSDGYFISTREEIQQIMMNEKELADESHYLSELKKEGSGLSFIGDGTRYDARNRLGRELNEKIPSSERAVESLQSSLDELGSYKEQRRSQYLKVKAGRKAWQMAFIFLLAAVVFLSQSQPGWLFSLSKIINHFVLIDLIKKNSLLFGILSVASLCSVAVLFLSGMFYRYRIGSALESGEKPSKHVAVLYTEALAAETEIGLYSSDILKKAWLIYNEREGISAPTKDISGGELTNESTQTSESLKPASASTKASAEISDQESEKLVKAWMKSLGYGGQSSFGRLATPLLFGVATAFVAFLIYNVQQPDATKKQATSADVTKPSIQKPEVVTEASSVGNPTKKPQASTLNKKISQVTLQAFECGDLCHLEYVDVSGETHSAICMDTKECQSWGNNPGSFDPLVNAKADLTVGEKFVEEGNEVMDNIIGISLLGGAPSKPTVVAAAAPVPSAHSVPHLCAASESPVFACSTGKKRASVCAVRSGAAEQLVYRLAPIEGAPEMVYPSAEVSATAAFQYGSQDAPDGKQVTFLSFDKGDYRYVVYAGEAQRQGIVVEQRGKRIASLRCQSDTMAAFDLAALQRMGLAQDGRGLQLP